MMREDGATSAPEELNLRIAQRVKALRSDRGMTLETLAVQSGVSRSMISLIERAETSATAVVLEKIAAAFGAPLAALFDDAGAPPLPVSRAADRTTWRDPGSGYLRRNISPPNFPSPFQIVAVTLPPGARVAYDSGPRDVAIYQQIWIQTGTIEVTVGATTHRLGSDDCLAMDLNEPTAFRNRTRKAARYIIVISSDRTRAPRN